MSPSISAQDLVAHYCSVEREFTPRGGLVFRSGRFFSPMVVVSGALRIDPLAGDDSTVRLALPGDLIGFEHMIGLPQACTGRALIGTVIAPLTQLPSRKSQDLLVRQLLLGHQRTAEHGRLRFGSAPDRVRALLLMLSSADATPVWADGAYQRPPAQPLRCELPRLSDIAALTDTAPETVSRVISSMRRSGLIARDDTAGSVRIDTLVSQRSANLPGGMTRSRISAAT